jgi:hypothetical protein
VTVFAKYESEQLVIEFAAGRDRDGWLIDETIAINALVIAGCGVNPKDLPSDLVAALHDLGREIEFPEEEGDDDEDAIYGMRRDER